MQQCVDFVPTFLLQQWYVLYPLEGPWYELLVIPLRFELLCSIMIPISIKVSLDLVKSLYAKFIDWDSEMIDYETGIPSHATNTAISEDLGQVEYIMTDKIGTLTENRMIFRRCCINGVFYGNESGDALKGFVKLGELGMAEGLYNEMIQSVSFVACKNEGIACVNFRISNCISSATAEVAKDL
ncbi:phospholipid-transporting ATPase 2-like [Hibiscus syriacus]|uniref:phospholipid-transporting ATPase 2-like n=1 Tax=Hibiscus syriacus TaxID=106335 RepID=UPI001924A385|nr:phospholipid-transporting ATPase 2-like [Hibiscus syriacus]